MPPIADLPLPPQPPELGMLRAPQAPYLWKIPQISSWVGSDMPPGLPGLVYAKIGAGALERLSYFCQWPAGWNNGSGEEIAWGTLQNFETFLGAARFRTANPPSLFLTDPGHLELAWEDRNGSEINVSLTPSGAAYFFASNGEEGTASAQELVSLAKRAAQETM